jgi:hypothetical protein
MLGSSGLAIMLAAAIAVLMFYLFPDSEPRQPRTPQPQRPRHEALLGATVATFSFSVLQCMDLQDSLSAHASPAVPVRMAICSAAGLPC